MSPRRNYPKNKRPKSDERDISTSSQTIEEHHEGMYIVRKLTGSSSNKPYRCPGCDQVIPMATPHTVAWLEDDEEDDGEERAEVHRKFQQHRAGLGHL